MTIRPRDMEIVGPTLAYAPYSSAEACRRLLQLAFRDCASVLDLTYGGGGFWTDLLPPGITLATNTYPSIAETFGLEDTYSRDFTDTGLEAGSFDLVVYDPPHVADGGEAGVMASRYGTARGTEGLRKLIVGGAYEAFRLARVGVLAKVADHAHGGEWLSLTEWIKWGATHGKADLYCAMHTYRPTFMNDPKWKVQRVPRSNGAIYLAYRKDGPKHRDWDREYERQMAIASPR